MSIHAFYKQFEYHPIYTDTSMIGVARFPSRANCPKTAIVKILNARCPRSSNEVNITSRLQKKSPYIVELYCYYQTTYNYVMFLEHCTGLSLDYQLKSKGITWKENRLVEWFRQVTDAVRVMHENRYAHRDIKPLNIFLTEQEEIRLGDFGDACAVRNDQYTLYPKGTMVYIPTPLRNMSGVPMEVAYLHDIWSLGKTFYEMCMGEYRTDLDTNNMQSALQTVNTSLIARGISGELTRLISDMLSVQVIPMSISQVADSIRRLQIARIPIPPMIFPSDTTTLPTTFESIDRDQCQYSTTHSREKLHRMRCGHAYCQLCLERHCKGKNGLMCPLCR